MILTYVSDARRQYERTILNISGMPRGGIVQFTYTTRRIADELLSPWRTNSLVGTQVIACFLTGNKNENDLSNISAVPVRVGYLVSSEVSGRYASMDVELADFLRTRTVRQVTLTSDCDDDGIVRPGPREGKFVLDVAVTFPAAKSAYEDLHAWQETVPQLTKIRMSPFTNSSFMLFEGLTKMSGYGSAIGLPAPSASSVIRPSGGKLQLSPGTAYEMMVHTMMPSPVDVSHTFHVHFDDKMVKLIDSPLIRAGKSFNTRRLLIRTADVGRNETSLVRMVPDPSVPGPELELEMRFGIRDSLLRRILRILLPAASAATAASAGVLPLGTSIWLRLSLVAIGSVTLALTTRR